MFESNAPAASSFCMFSNRENSRASWKMFGSADASPSTARRARKYSAGEARSASYRTSEKFSRPENSLIQSFIALMMACTPNLLSRSISLTVFCLSLSGAFGSRLVSCKYKETKQSRGSRVSRIIFARSSSRRGIRYLPRNLSQPSPLVRCSNRS